MISEYWVHTQEIHTCYGYGDCLRIRHAFWFHCLDRQTGYWHWLFLQWYVCSESLTLIELWNKQWQGIDWVCYWMTTQLNGSHQEENRLGKGWKGNKNNWKIILFFRKFGFTSSLLGQVLILGGWGDFGYINIPWFIYFKVYNCYYVSSNSSCNTCYFVSSCKNLIL